MKTKKKLAVTAAAGFGAALSSVYLAPELQADIVDITWNGGNSFAVHIFTSGTFNPATQDIDQVAPGSSSAGDFNQYNDQFGTDSIGRSMFVAGGRGIASIALVSVGQTILNSTFAGASNLGVGSNSTFNGTGTRYIGFRSQAGYVGWFKVSFTAQDSIVYSVGQYGSMGEDVTVNAIPEPGSLAGLALLALGATGLRRKRKAA